MRDVCIQQWEEEVCTTTLKVLGLKGSMSLNEYDNYICSTCVGWRTPLLASLSQSSLSSASISSSVSEPESPCFWGLWNVKDIWVDIRKPNLASGFLKKSSAVISLTCALFFRIRQRGIIGIEEWSDARYGGCTEKCVKCSRGNSRQQNVGNRIRLGERSWMWFWCVLAVSGFNLVPGRKLIYFVSPESMETFSDM